MPTVLAVFVIVHELTLHNTLGGVTLQSAGVNFASAASLSSGHLLYGSSPYYFPLTSPPGMSILLLPFAFAAHGGDAGGAMSAARIFTAAVSVFDVFLAGFTARRHGIAASFAAGVLLAVFPFQFYATSSYTTEPFLVLFCLLAFQTAFSQGELVHGRRLVWAGALIGMAMAIKGWALIPAIVLVICAAIHHREALIRMLGGIVAGFGIPCILFFLAAPGPFVHDVITAELTSGSGTRAISTSSRIAELLGLGAPIGLHNATALAGVVGAIVVIVVLIAALLRATTASIQDWAILGTTAGLAAIAFIPASLPIAYTYFLAAFAVIVVAGALGTILSLISTMNLGAGDVSSTLAGGLTVIIVSGMVALVTVAAPKEAAYEKSWFLSNGSDPAAEIDQFIPAGACVISNNPEAIVIANRFTDLPANCPILPDPAGIVKAAGSPVPTSDNATVVAEWEQAFRFAEYYVQAPGPIQVPWSPSLQAFFSQNYSILHNGAFTIYENKTPLV